MQGKLIVFEGVEGCGKTTQMKRLQDWLYRSDLFRLLQAQGVLSQLISTREPGGTKVGQKIRQLLLDLPTTETEPIQSRAELLLYAADRAQHVEEQLNPLLKQGALILCDRFTDSTIAYQGYGRNLDRSLINHLNQVATNGLVSDLTLWLDLDVEIGLERTRQRGHPDRMEQSDLAFHRRVQQGFFELFHAEPHRIVRINANRPVDEVAVDIQSLLKQKLTQWYQPLLLPS